MIVHPKHTFMLNRIRGSVIGLLLLGAFSFGVVATAEAGLKYGNNGNSYKTEMVKHLDVEYVAGTYVTVYEADVTLITVPVLVAKIEAPLLAKESRCNSPPNDNLTTTLPQHMRRRE